MLTFMLVFLNFLFLFKSISVGHWSYLFSTWVYPNNSVAGLKFTFALVFMEAFFSLLPDFFCPRLKIVTTSLTIPPQLHMIYLLYRSVIKKTHNTTMRKLLIIYAILNFASILWTIRSLIKKLKPTIASTPSTLASGTNTISPQDRTS